MADKWTRLSTGRFYPRQLQVLADSLTSTAGTIEDALSAVRTVLSAAQALIASLPTDATEALLRAAIQEILDGLDALAGDTTAHGILLPIQKNFYGLGERTPADEVDPRFSVRTTFDGLISDGGFVQTNAADLAPETIDFINDVDTAINGVQGYYRTLMLSLRDPGDPNVPEFDTTFAVAGVSVVWGSNGLSDLQKVTELFRNFVWLGSKNDSASRTSPVVQNFRARVAPSPASGDIGVILEWDPIAPVKFATLYTNQTIVNEEIFVIRSTDPAIRQRFSWTANFPNQPSDSRTDLPSNDTSFTETRVIARIPNDGVVRSYVDTDGISVEERYYYSLAVRFSIRENIADEQGEVQPMGPLCAVRQVFYTARPAASLQSQPPDWFAAPSLIQLFPNLQDFLSFLRLNVETYLLSRTATNSGLADMIQQLVDTIDDLIQELQRINSYLSRLSDILKALANADIGSVHVTGFTVRQGGMREWTSQLARRLSDPADSSRPTFDDTDLCGGLVIVAGAPGPAALSSTCALFKLLFGVCDDTSSVSDRILDIFGDDPAARPVSSLTRGGAPGASDPLGTSESALLAGEDPSSLAPVPAVLLPPRFTDDFTPVHSDEPDEEAKPVFDEQMNPSATEVCE